MPRIERHFTYTEDREEYLDVPVYLIDKFVVESEDYDHIDLNNKSFIQDLWYFLVEENDQEPLTHDYDSWYGNPLGSDSNESFRLGVENA